LSSATALGVLFLLGISQPVSAQTLPTGFDVLALKPVVIAGKIEDSQAHYLNSRGEVAGWVNQSAGTVLKWVANDNPANPFPLFTLPKLTSVPVINVSPVIWTQGSAKVLTRYGGNTGTWPFGFAGDDTLVVILAPQSGKTDARYGVGSAAYIGPPASRRSATLRSGQYTMLPDAFNDGHPTAFNATGSFLGDKFFSSETGYGTVLLKAGKLTDIPVPAGQWYNRVKAVNNAGVALMNGGAYASPNQLCHLWKDGQTTPVSAPSLPDLGVKPSAACLALNSLGDVAGVLRWDLSTPTQTKFAMAVFRWRQGNLEMSPVETWPRAEFWDQAYIDDSGRVVFTKDGFEDAGMGGSAPAVFTNGAPVLLRKLLGAATSAAPYLATGYIRLLDVNAAGQILVSDGSKNGVVSPVVLTPR
jgi:hypothetical protein